MKVRRSGEGMPLALLEERKAGLQHLGLVGYKYSKH